MLKNKEWGWQEKIVMIVSFEKSADPKLLTAKGFRTLIEMSKNTIVAYSLHVLQYIP